MEGCLGEESFQLWELNRRLEVYLSRVKALEEQNELLSAELGGLRAQSADVSWRARAEDELAALRALVDQRWREKHAAEVARDNLVEELEGVAGRCQQQRLARERAAEEAARSRRAVEAEKSSRSWLSSQAADLERELELLRAAHEEERACLNEQAASAPRGPAPPRAPPAPAPEVQELALRLGEAWRGAVRGYQERVEHLETSLGQARERLGRAVQGVREGRLELQQLQAERGGLQERRAALEQRLEGRWQEGLHATEKFQLAVEALEQEKQGLQTHIAQVLEGRQQLAHLKMSLSLEVASYRTLLEAENTRLQTPGSGPKTSLSFQDPKPELRFPVTPAGRRLGPLPPILNLAPVTSPLPDTLKTPVPAFLKSQEFLQAYTPTLASTPIPPTPQAPCPATDTEIKAQKAPLALLPSQGGKQQASEPLWTEAKVAIPTSILRRPEEPGGQQQEASSGQLPEDQVSSAPPLNSDPNSLEARDGEPSGSGVPSTAREDSEGQACGLTKEEASTEVKVGHSLQQGAWREEGYWDREGLQDSVKSVEEELQEPLLSADKQSGETLRGVERERQDGPRAGGEEDSEIPSTPEREDGGQLRSSEEGLEAVGSPAEQTLEPLAPGEKEEPQTSGSLAKETREPLGSVPERLEAFSFPGQENQEVVRSLEEEDGESLRALAKDSLEPLPSQEAEDEEVLGKENPEPLGSLDDEHQEALEQEKPDTPKPPGDQHQEVLAATEQESLGLLEEKPQTLRSVKETQEPQGSLEAETLEQLLSLKADRVGVEKSLELENVELPKAAEEGLGISDAPEPLWPLEEKTQGTPSMPLEQDIQKPLGPGQEVQESLSPLEKENQGPLRSLDSENVKSSAEAGQESPRYWEEERKLEARENKAAASLLEDEGPSADQWWEAAAVVKGQVPPPGVAATEKEVEVEVDLGEQDDLDGKEEAVGLAWNTGRGPPAISEPEVQKVPVEGADGTRGAEGFQDPEGQLEWVGAPDLGVPLGMPEAEAVAVEGMLEKEDVVPGGDPASAQVTLGSETAVGESVGATEGQEKEAVQPQDPDLPEAREDSMELPLRDEGLGAENAQGLGEPWRDLKEAETLESGLAKLPRESRDPQRQEDTEGWAQSESEHDSAEEGFPAETLCPDAPQPRPEEGAPPGLELPSPRPTEPWGPPSHPHDVSGAQPQTEGSLEAGWGLGSGVEALEKLEDRQEQGLDSEGVPGGFQEEEEQSGEESEADELGETLPDSTPLGLFPGSTWDPAGEERPSPQGEARQESWGPSASLGSEGLGAGPSEAEEEGEEEGHSPGSDLSEEFEDLGTEASLLPGGPETLRQVPQLLLEPAVWDRDEESDGFADEEESGEDYEEEEGRGTGQWGPRSSVGNLQTLSGLQRGDLMESEAAGVSVPWDGEGPRGVAADAPMPALQPESQDSAEASSPEEPAESDPAPLQREDAGSGPMETPSGVEGTGHQGTGEILGVNGQGPSWGEHVNGDLEQSEGGGPGKLGAPEGGKGSPSEVEEGDPPEAPWAGIPLRLGQGQFLKFTQREGDGDSWSSGED
ncbi:nestin [Tenrec ecaudatus]|uniref:nestin n=1 Tax=Tenrec ecaudatus TaxID=94439 RepID=UPI003F5A6D72